MTADTLLAPALLPGSDATADAGDSRWRPGREVHRAVPRSSAEPVAVARKRQGANGLRIATTNVCLLRLLERIAKRFNRAQIPLMALKGAALNLTIYDQPDQRPMDDIDLMIRLEHVEPAIALLEELGCRRGRPLVRDDFFPRFHYETEFIAGRTFSLRIDLHVRPFRPLRYARLVPAEALWQEAEVVQIGQGEVLIPSVEDMLIHLAAHSAFHANVRPMWLLDIRRWSETWRHEIDWERFVTHMRAWGLTLPVRDAIERTERTFGAVCPPEIRSRLAKEHVNRRDHLVLRQTPRDAEHPVAHVLVNALCTPGFWFVLSYLRAVLVPGRQHMGEWYGNHHWGWLPFAHVLRLLSPVLRRIPRVWTRFIKTEVRETPRRGPCVFATRNLSAGEVIARGGQLKYMSHSCRPNAELCGSKLRTLKAINAGGEITIDYGESACNCRRHKPQTDKTGDAGLSEFDRVDRKSDERGKRHEA